MRLSNRENVRSDLVIRSSEILWHARINARLSDDVKYNPRARGVAVRNSEEFNRSEVVCVGVREKGRSSKLSGSKLEKVEFISPQRVHLETKWLASLRDPFNKWQGVSLPNNDHINGCGVGS